MLNFYNYSIIDSTLLEDSFNKIQQQSRAEIVTGPEAEQVYQQTIRTIRTPNETKNFSFENLLKIQGRSGNFYIAQCVIDFGYPPSGIGFPGTDIKYALQLIGIAKSNTDLGNTFIRPESEVDKWIGHFIHQGITFDHEIKFSDKYSLTSDKKDVIQQTFGNSFLDCISKYDGLLLATNGTEMYISFTTGLSVEQGVIVMDVFNACGFLDKM